MTTALSMNALRGVGYVLSFVVGAILWPQLMEIGFRYENTNFFLAITFLWGCLPVSMCVTWVGSVIYMRAIHFVGQLHSKAIIERSIQTAALLGIAGTLGSCGMIASGYEPPELLHPIYNLDLSGKFR